MYFLSAEEMCETVSPACGAMSSNRGTTEDAGDGAGGGLGAGLCAGESGASNSKNQKPHRVRIVKRIYKL